MIPNIFIQNWSNHVKWQTPVQIEQDLIISTALVDLYNDPHIKDAFRYEPVITIEIAMEFRRSLSIRCR